VGYRLNEVIKDRDADEKREVVRIIDGTTLKEMKEDGVYELKVYYTRIKNASK
jgi:endonuclease YncB( thermonuclease family)